MGHKLKTHGYWLKIYINAAEQRTNEQAHAHARKVSGLIARHVSHHADYDALSIERDADLQCEHCGYQWTEGKDAPHNGGCCALDAANMPEET